MDLVTLLNLDWHDNENQKRQLNIVNHGCAKWRGFGEFIGMSPGELDGIDTKHRSVAEQFKAVLNHWIQTGGTPRYCATWLGLQTILRDLELGTLAGMIKEAMPFLDL